MIEPLTVEEVMQLVAANHVVCVHPHKRVVVIDGWKRRVVKGVTDWKAFAKQINGKK